MSKVWITSDCTCDLSKVLLDKYEVEVIYFYISTDRGCFKDRAEMTSTNVVEYFENGGQRISTAAPAVSEYVDFFEKALQKHDEIIHITISSQLSLSYENAVVASKQFAGKVHVVDSEHLSTGIAHMIIRAVEMAKEGMSRNEIVDFLEEMKYKVSTSFIADNADYLYRTGRVSKTVKNICTTFRIHPVLSLKNGKMIVKGVRIGNLEKCILGYVKSELRKSGKIKKERLFITYSTCPVRIIGKIKEQIKLCCPFEEIWETKASATITSNCGANTVGVLFVRE